MLLKSTTAASAGVRGAGRTASVAGNDPMADAEVLRKLRRRSLARLRKEAEPVEPEVLGRFLPQWQHLSTAQTRGNLRGIDGVLSAIAQLAGCPVPASALYPLVLATRASDYEPSVLAALPPPGAAVSSGHRCLPGITGWVRPT